MSSSARIIRAKHDKDNPYFMMRRDSAQDESLSWEARGMLCYLLSKPDDWEINVKDLQQQCGQGRVYRIINELKDARYIKDREKKHNPETGKWEWTPYIVFEHPQPDNVIHITETVTRKPQHGNPDTVNREIIQSTEEQSTETKEDIKTNPPVEVDTSQDGIDLIAQTELAEESDTGKTAKGIIAVYLKTTKTVNSNAYRFWMADAKELAGHDITPAHIAEWIKHITSQDWWTSGMPSWSYLCKEIVAWRDDYEAEKATPRIDNRLQARKAPANIAMLQTTGEQSA